VATDRHVERDREPVPTTGQQVAPEQSSEKRSGEERKAEYLTARQLGEILQVSESTIHRLRRAGRIPAVVLTDRLIRFNLRDVQKALRPAYSNRAQANSDDANPAREREPDPQLSFDDLFAATGDGQG
jgi:excisionase family DNA binding protein